MAKQLKRGLNALLADIEDVREDVKAEEKIYTVGLDTVEPNPDQPRKEFSFEKLSELAQSIKNHGIIQPIVVRKEGAKYVIIAGERRYRAAKLAGLKEVPVIIKNYGDLKVKEISLIENLQREDLNAIEEANAIKELMTAYGLTQEEIAEKLGRSRPALTNTLRLLALPDDVQELIIGGKISAGHGRALLSVNDPVMQLRMASMCAEEGWSVRETERRAALFAEHPIVPKPPKEESPFSDADIKRITADMTKMFSAKVKVVGGGKKGRICIDYASPEELKRIYELIGSIHKR